MLYPKKKKKRVGYRFLDYNYNNKTYSNTHLFYKFRINILITAYKSFPIVYENEKKGLLIVFQTKIYLFFRIVEFMISYFERYQNKSY